MRFTADAVTHQFRLFAYCRDVFMGALKLDTEDEY